MGLKMFLDWKKLALEQGSQPASLWTLQNNVGVITCVWTLYNGRCSKKPLYFGNWICFLLLTTLSP